MSTIQDVLSAGTKLTPMMAQYFEIKKNYPDTIVLYRMGDFYELFFDDAKLASQILNITLTHRGKLGDFPIPMAGIPHHAAATYVDRITSKGLKAVICEQIEDPKMAVGIVKRAVTQIVSPGMPFDLEKTNSTETKYMAAGFRADQNYYLVLIDFTTGDFVGVNLPSEKEFLEKLISFSPKEFITYKDQWKNSPLVEEFLKGSHLLRTTLPETYFSGKENDFYISKLIPHFKKDNIIKMHQDIINPIGALSYYIFSTQGLEHLYHIKPFRLQSLNGSMQATLSTLVSLEILPKSRESYNDSLLGYFDKTKTAMGARALRNLFLSPLTDLRQIEARHKILFFLKENLNLMKDIREKFESIRDIERILAKLSTKKITAQDLLNLSLAIKTFTTIQKNIPEKVAKYFWLLKEEQTKKLLELSALIDKTINDEIGAHLEKGNLIREGASKDRDRLCRLSLKASDELIKMETKYREKTGINNLRIKYNNVNGYFIEISKSHVNKVPKSFERRQTLVNAERFTSEELSNFEKEIITAKEKLERLEKEIFDNILAEVSHLSLSLQQLSQIIAELDINQSLAWMILQDNLTKPTISENVKILNLKGAWHPLIKSLIKDEFVAHDLNLDEKTYFGLITGPNMAGKTTVMREVAIIQFLAQIGSYVPAVSADLSLCDALYSRLGASDDILRGQSTFMVEMTETSEILRHATERSLIIIDEIGRGTSTYDGLSIAWALVEFFVQKTKALTLFSTHYHELIELATELKPAKNLTVETINKNGTVQFLYRLIEEGATQSFGIHVASLAGLPREILDRSSQILHELENKEKLHSEEIQTSQLSLFDSKPTEFLELKTNLEKIDLLNMTPLQAMQKLHELQKLIEN